MNARTLARTDSALTGQQKGRADKPVDGALVLNMLIAYCNCACTGLRLMADWPVPEGLEGDAGLLRVYATAARAGDRACPQYLAAKARPGLWPPQCTPRREPGLAQFPLDPVMALLDMAEYDGLTLEQAQARLRDGRTASRPHPGLLRWAGHASARYLSAGAALDAVRGWVARPASRPWVMQVAPSGDAGGFTYELCAWGRRYESADGQMRELRLPRLKSVADRAIDPGEAAAAAMVLARGSMALGRPRSGKPHYLGRPQQVRCIRVAEVGCEDGSWQVMFDGPPEKARQQYDEHARKRLAAVTAGGEYRPGDSCADCKLLDSCPALPRRRGLLGINSGGRPVRNMVSHERPSLSGLPGPGVPGPPPPPRRRFRAEQLGAPRPGRARLARRPPRPPAG